MSISLNHTIVWCRDQQRSATFVASLPGRPEPTHFEPFPIVDLDNGVSLDFLAISGDIAAQHYAFLTSEAEVDAIFGRIVEQAVAYWADPGLREAGRINRHDGGRGVYFKDPDGHLLESITRPYGSGD